MGDCEVNIVISKEDFQYYWKRAKERTASSFLALYFGYYKLSAYTNFLPKVHVLKLLLITRTGSTPDRWARFFPLMLKQIERVALIMKLW